jgi:hypothetical protein
MGGYRPSVYQFSYFFFFFVSGCKTLAVSLMEIDGFLGKKKNFNDKKLKYIPKQTRRLQMSSVSISREA